MAVARASASVMLSAIVDPAPAAADIAAQAGVPLYQSLEELLARDRPDGLILATPNPLHVPQALQCIDAKLPILLEKPIATTVAGLEPDTAANNIHANTDAIAKPPRKWPTAAIANRTIRLATPPVDMRLPANTKNGMAMSV